jgi:hypothetical protein
LRFFLSFMLHCAGLHLHIFSACLANENFILEHFARQS